MDSTPNTSPIGKPDSGAVTGDTIRGKLLEVFEQVEIEDQSGGCGQAFLVTVTSSKFDKKPRLARSRMVNAQVTEEIKGIHAWTVKCVSPAEAEVKMAG